MRRKIYVYTTHHTDICLRSQSSGRASEQRRMVKGSVVKGGRAPLVAPIFVLLRRDSESTKVVKPSEPADSEPTGRTHIKFLQSAHPFSDAPAQTALGRRSLSPSRPHPNILVSCLYVPEDPPPRKPHVQRDTTGTKVHTCPGLLNVICLLGVGVSPMYL